MTATEPQPAAATDPRRWVSSTPDERLQHAIAYERQRQAHAADQPATTPAESGDAP